MFPLYKGSVEYPALCGPARFGIAVDSIIAPRLLSEVSINAAIRRSDKLTLLLLPGRDDSRIFSLNNDPKRWHGIG